MERRLAELDSDLRGAVLRYVDLMRADPYHPLARAARERLDSAPLARVADAEGRRLASSRLLAEVYAAWLLLDDDPAGEAARRRLERTIRRWNGAIAVR